MIKFGSKLNDSDLQWHEPTLDLSSPTPKVGSREWLIRASITIGVFVFIAFIALLIHLGMPSMNPQ